MANRTAQIKIGESVTVESPLTCGLPQGPPISPIIFMLYTEPIHRLRNPRHTYSYADDIAFLQTGRSLTDCIKMLINDLERVAVWGNTNSITFEH